MIAVKVTAEECGKKFAILVPAVIDSDGWITITHIAAGGAAKCLQAAAYPDTIKPLPMTSGPRRKRKR